VLPSGCPASFGRYDAESKGTEVRGTEKVAPHVCDGHLDEARRIDPASWCLHVLSGYGILHRDSNFFMQRTLLHEADQRVTRDAAACLPPH
jgi:hypothetical protein